MQSTVHLPHPTDAVSPKLFLFILFVVTMGVSAYFVLPRGHAPQFDRGKAEDFSDETAASPDFAAGYKTGEYFARKPGNHDLSPAGLKALSAEEFKKSGKTHAIDWQSGFERGFKHASEKPRAEADAP